MDSEYMSIKGITTKFKKWEVKRENVQISRVIGKGAFCQVAKATVSDINGIKGATTVAVKMLKGMLRRQVVGTYLLNRNYRTDYQWINNFYKEKSELWKTYMAKRLFPVGIVCCVL